MKENDTFRTKLLDIITKNPGLHFRELQRRTGAAVGKLDYHLYQMERKGEIYSMKDEHLVRFFSSTADTMLERRIALHMRNQVSKEILIRAALDGKSEIHNPGARVIRILDVMKEDNIISYVQDPDIVHVTLNDRDIIIKFLKRYSGSFIDSIAYSIFKMLDEL
ncbi:MAG: winged helix-turn-helix transcriptional regulator [Thermoplasmata archaeon]